MLRTGEFQQRATELGEHLHAELGLLTGTGRVTRRYGGAACGPGVDIDPAYGTGGRSRKKLMDRGVLVK